VDVFKIGTEVHALMPGGVCAFGFVTRWDVARQIADLALFPGGPAQGAFTSTKREFAHREQPGPTDELTFHVAARCPWNR
jgi:hypothetical protein